MKRWIAVVAIGIMGAASAGMAEARPPTVGPRLANYGARLALKKFPIWRYRDSGSIDCRGGQISRIAWTCRIRIYKDGVCRSGRALTFSTNDQSAEGPYRAKVNFGHKFRCSGV